MVQSEGLMVQSEGLMVVVSLPSQMLSGGREGQGLQARYVVLDSDGDRLVPTHSLAPTYSAGVLGGLRPLGRSFLFPGGRPSKDNFCWFSPEEACTGGASPPACDPSNPRPRRCGAPSTGCS